MIFAATFWLNRCPRPTWNAVVLPFSTSSVWVGLLLFANDDSGMYPGAVTITQRLSRHTVCAAA